MKLEKTEKNTKYEVVKSEAQLYSVKATIGKDGVVAYFYCLEIEFNNDFNAVKERLKNLLHSSLLNAI